MMLTADDDRTYNSLVTSYELKQGRKFQDFVKLYIKLPIYYHQNHYHYYLLRTQANIYFLFIYTIAVLKT